MRSRIALCLLFAFVCSVSSAAFGALSQPTPDPNSIVGIGAVLGPDNGGFPSIVRLVKSGPADLDGRLKVNDRIAAVAQGKGDFVTCANLPVGAVVEMIRGEKGSTVRLQIIPAGVADPKQTKIIQLVRAEIKEANFADAAGGGAGGAIVIQNGNGVILFNAANGQVRIQPGPFKGGAVPIPAQPAQPDIAPPAVDNAEASAAPSPSADIDSSDATTTEPDATPAISPDQQAGIGITLAGGRDYPVVASILPNSPAQRDGRLRINDRVTGISQGDAPFTDCKGIPLPQAESLLHGAKDSKVRLEVLPAAAANDSARQVIPLTRSISAGTVQ